MDFVPDLFIGSVLRRDHTTANMNRARGMITASKTYLNQITNQFTNLTYMKIIHKIIGLIKTVIHTFIMSSLSSGRAGCTFVQ